MNALKKLNEIYGKYLFAVIPAVTLILAICEVLYEISHGDVMHIVAYILMGFVSISFCGFYLMSGKQKISYCLIELWLFVYTVFLTLDNHLHFSDIMWIVFLPCAILCLIFIILFNRERN